MHNSIANIWRIRIFTFPKIPLFPAPPMLSLSTTAPATTASAAVPDLNWESDEWDLFNDDGFVHKRKKRRLDSSIEARPPDPLTNPELELKWKRERKRIVLLKLKEKYASEISRWDNLSNMLKTMEVSVTEKREKERYEKGKENRREEGIERKKIVVPMEWDSGSLVNELVLKVQEQESIIRHVTNLCDAAEELCTDQQENIIKCYNDLPIWGSPRELMTSLCED